MEESGRAGRIGRVVGKAASAGNLETDTIDGMKVLQFEERGKECSTHASPASHKHIEGKITLELTS